MIEVRGLSAELGEFRLRDVSLRIEAGEYFGVIGPTGAGKTVLLECIAGLVTPAAGEVWIDGRDATRAAPEQRRVGYLPQDYALFPHLTVRENLIFGLTVRGRATEGQDRLGDLIDTLGIGHLLEREPATLSGGEKQRVALGRALMTDPTVMLLDEPLSALDVVTRWEVGDFLRRVHDRAGITSIHICHDFAEVMRLADRVALIRNGALLQVGTPQELLRRPRTRFAAEFVRGENIYAGGGSAVSGAGGRCRVAGHVWRVARVVAGPCHAMVRPDDITLTAPGAAVPEDMNSVVGVIRRVEDRGAAIAVSLDAGIDLVAFVPRPRWREMALDIGDRAAAVFDPDSVHTFPRDGD